MSRRAEIRKVNGIARLFVNDRPMAGITYHNRQTDFVPYMKQFANSGTMLFFSYYVRNWSESWDEHFDKVAKKLDDILALNDRLVVIPGLYLSADKTWAKANQGELCRLDGKPCMKQFPVANTTRWKKDSGCTTAGYSFASSKIDEISAEHVNRTLDFLESYSGRDRVIGMFFGGGSTHEWNAFTPDPGLPAIEAYRKYLTRKYRDEKELRKSWDDPNASFESLTAPDTSEMNTSSVGYYLVPRGKGQRVIDWKLALAEAKSQRILNAGKAIKARRPDLIAGCFHGNWYRDPGVTQRILESKFIDYLVSPPQYHARCPGQHMALNQMVDSIGCYGKLFVSEEDLFPHDAPYRDYLKKRKFRLPFQGDAESLQETLAVYEKGFGLTIAKGTMAWYYHFQHEYFKREKQYFRMNRCMTDISRLTITEKCCSDAEILVVIDECSSIYLRDGTRVVQKQTDRELTFEFGYIGAPHDVMFMDALAHPDMDFSRYKVIFFLNSHMATRKQRRIVNKLKAEGRTLVFGHGSGFLADSGAGVENMKSLTGFNFEQLNIECAPTVIMVDTPNAINRHLSLGYTFGQSYRAMRRRADGKGNPLFPPPANVSPLFAVADRHAVDVGFYNLEMPAGYKTAAMTRGATPYKLAGFTDWPRYFVGMALKEHEDWNSIYAGTPVIPTRLLRAICKYAGVHLYVESDDVIYCNNKFLVLHTNQQAGPRELKLPRRTNVYDLKSGRELGRRVKSLKMECPARRTWLLWLDDKPPAMARNDEKRRIYEPDN